MLRVESTYLIFLALVALSRAGCGVFTGPSGNKYSLDALSNNDIDYNGTESGTTYKYLYNYCQNIKSNAATCPSPSPVVQVSQSGTCTPIGYLPIVITETSKDNLKLVYTNNVASEMCGNPKTIARVSTFLLSCAATEYSLVEEPGICQYQFTIQTKYACAGGSPGPNPSGGKGDDKLSAGSWFLIFFFVGLAVYFAAGVVVKWKVYNASGVELVPNTELWLGLPGLIRDGFLFVKNKLTGAVGYSSL